MIYRVEDWESLKVTVGHSMTGPVFTEQKWEDRSQSDQSEATSVQTKVLYFLTHTGIKRYFK